MINTVGIGSPEGSYILDPATGGNKKDEMGNTVITKLNEEELKILAENTKGVYVRLQNTDEAVDAVKKNLSQIEKKALGDVSLMNFKTYYWWFASAMLIFLLVESFIPERKKVTA
jgi:Ca-activated chloride channel family protein